MVRGKAGDVSRPATNKPDLASSGPRAVACAQYAISCLILNATMAQLVTACVCT
jgi:hypothetical protein